MGGSAASDDIGASSVAIDGGEAEGESGNRTAIAVGIFYTALFLLAMFGAAGRWDWWAGWCYLGLAVAVKVAAAIYLKRANPELFKVRMRIGEGTKAWDRAWLAGMRILMLAIVVVAGLDAVRFGWSSLSIWYWLAGLTLFVPGNLLAARAMAENRHFEGTVRVQRDRGHRLIDTGPYAVIRHPGYAGFVLIIVPTPLFLGSWWAFVPTAVMVAWLAVRIVLEERTLSEGLEGYREYTGRVKYRLLPGVW